MRFLLRLGVLVLAVVGAKALYDQFAPKAVQLKGPAGDVLDTAKHRRARDVTQHAKDAAAEVADDARQKASRREGPGVDRGRPGAGHRLRRRGLERWLRRRRHGPGLTASPKRAGASIIG